MVMVFAAWFLSCRDLVAATAPAAGRAAATAPAATAGAAQEDYCFKCHQAKEGTSTTFKNDIHYSQKLSCADCHGGNPKTNDMDLAKKPEAGFRSRLARQDVPMFCAGCHGNARFMADYKASLPTNQMALYTRSIHGTKLAAGNDKAAQCIDCHGIHDIRAAGDPQSRVNARNVTNTCAKCHPDEANLLRQDRNHQGRTNCVTCHGDHDVQTATTALLTGPDRGCGRCHQGNSGPARTATQIAQLISDLEKAGPASKEGLAAARKAVHSFNVGAIQRAITSAPPKPATAPAAETRTATASAPAGAAAKDVCLRCHPFDKIVAASATYVAPSGEKGTPHLRVPHDSKDDKDIPECTNCHAAHPLAPMPAQGSIDLSKVGVAWCYDKCHHTKTLESCKKCH